MRLAVVQHGDMRAAVATVSSGAPETYYAMKYSVEVLSSLTAGCPHLVISLNAPAYREERDGQCLLGLPRPKFPSSLPETFEMLAWGRRVCQELERFKPTHVLVRTAGILALMVLRYCHRHSLNTAVVFANLFQNEGLRNRLLNRRLVRFLNEPNVRLVGNHKHPATRTMLQVGLLPEKAVAWDWPGAKSPRGYPQKSLRKSESGIASVLYAGNVVEEKGVGDLIEAIALLHSGGHSVELTVVGDGADLERYRKRVAALPAGLIRLLGRIGNEQVFGLMLESDLVCVPSRHCYSEGMPLTLTEALASRTPVIASDHPVLLDAFRDGEGVRFFRAANPRALSMAILAVLSDAQCYAHLSRTTCDAYARVECTTSFGDLIQRWKGTF